MGNSLSDCLVCGAAGTVIVQGPEFPLVLNDKIRVNSCTYRMRPVGGKNWESWEFNFEVNYTNITSEAGHLLPEGSLYSPGAGYGFGGSYITFGSIVNPNESATCIIKCRVPRSYETHILTLR